MPKLIVNPGSEQAWEIPLKEGTTRIGRNASNDAQINDPSVSGSHCEITVSGGTITIKDLGSTNGTFINGAPVQESVLTTGQTLQFGGVQLALHLEAEAAAPPPPRRITLQLSGHGSPPPPPLMAPGGETTMAEETEPVIAQIPSGPRFCKFHPKSPARYLCPKCNRTFCELCVTSRNIGGISKKSCRTCAVECTPLQVAHVAAAGQRGFFAKLPGSFIYPFKGFGSLVVIFATLLFAAGNFVGCLLQIAIYGLVFLFMQNIIHTTTMDENEPLGFPNPDGLFGAAFQMAGTILVSFGLPIGLIAAKLFGDVDIPTAAIMGTVILSCLYFPMAFLAVAMKDSIAAANPLVVIPAIAKVPIQYLVVTVLVIAVFGMRQLGDMVSGAASDISFSTRDMSVLLLALGGRAFWALGSVYLLTVSIRMLGLFYNENKEKLEWY